MKFENLTFNWQNVNDDYALSNQELQILLDDGSLLGALKWRTPMMLRANSLSFQFESGTEKNRARVESVDDVWTYWRICLEQNTLERISKSNLDIFISKREVIDRGFELRDTSKGVLNLDFYVESVEDIFQELNQIRGGKYVDFFSGTTDSNLTDLDNQLALLEFNDNSIGGYANIAILRSARFTENELSNSRICAIF